MNIKKIENLIKKIIMEIGDDPNREGLSETPSRVAKMYAEIYSGYQSRSGSTVKLFQETKYGEGIVLRGIPFYSMCEHHMMPFFGTVNIAYIPGNEKIPGLSKFAGIIEHYSKRLQLQERLGQQICDFIMDEISTQGALVIIKAEHLCMSMRGVKKPGINTITVASKGLLSENYQLRMEYFPLLNS